MKLTLKVSMHYNSFLEKILVLADTIKTISFKMYLYLKKQYLNLFKKYYLSVFRITRLITLLFIEHAHKK